MQKQFSIAWILILSLPIPKPSLPMAKEAWSIC